MCISLLEHLQSLSIYNLTIWVHIPADAKSYSDIGASTAFAP